MSAEASCNYLEAPCPPVEGPQAALPHAMTGKRPFSRLHGENSSEQPRPVTDPGNRASNPIPGMTNSRRELQSSRSAREVVGST